MKIFIGILEVAGFYVRLCKGFDKIGITADYYCSYHKFEYTSLKDYNNILGKALYIITKYHYILIKSDSKIKSPIIRRTSWFLIQLSLITLKLLILFFSLLKYDVFIFSFGQTILPFNIDLPILKFFKKKIIVNIFHGSEARPNYIDLYEIELREKEKILKNIYKGLKTKKNRIHKIQKYADYIIGSFFTSHFLTRKYIEYLNIGLPALEISEIDEILKTEKNKTTDEKEKIKILHSPSKSLHKGTNIIKQTIEKLKKTNDKIEYIETTNKRNHEILKALQECDFVVDQLYSDTPLAGLGNEASSFGKPTIVGGYIWGKFNEIHNQYIIPPSYTCHPNEIEKAIEYMINNKEFRKSLGEKAKQFVTTFWSPKEIAKKFIKIINNDFPQEWYKEPIKDYAHFALIDEKTGKEFLKSYIEKYGEEALLLDDKPLLKKAFIDLMKS